MELGSSEGHVEESHLQGQCGSTSAGELDANFTGGREVQSKDSDLENSEATYGLQSDSNQLGRQDSSSLPNDFKIENLEDPVDNSHSLPTEFTYDQKTQPPLEDNDCQGEMDELSGSYFHKTSLKFMAKTSHSERGTEDSAYSQEFPITVDDSQAEKMEGKSNIDRFRTTDKGEVDVFEEKPKWEDREPENGKNYSKNSPTESGRMDLAHSHPHSSGNTTKHSASSPTPRQMSVSPEKSLQIHHSPTGHGLLSSQEGFLEPSDPQALSRPRKSTSRERSGRHKDRQSSSPIRSDQAKKVSSRDHLSSSTKQTSDSPHSSQHKDGSFQSRRYTSSEFHKLPTKYGRAEKSGSRSPIRKRDSSSGYKRDHRGRSRSISPYMRDRRRSPRVRKFPRQRSPGFHSSHHSPCRRPWVPPPNRRTGLGKPGNNLFVAGFSFLTTERDLERKFSRFGHVRDVRIVRDKRSGDSRGFGFLSMERDEDADAAIRALDETEWNGRIILVEKSKSH